MIDEELQRALGALWHPNRKADHIPDRNAAEAMLQRLADGGNTDDDRVFVRELARCLLAAGGKTAPVVRRENAVLRAAGLSGKYEHNRAFAEAATVLQGFDGYTKASAIRTARSDGTLHDSVDDNTARKRIDALVKK
jgi:hypothetical protein